jgi:predicted enzyme related to lactoylglutathione lyase
MGFQSATAFKKASADRVKELLRILNYLAAPFGSQEDLLLTAGIPGTDYNRDPSGNPVLTDRGNADANQVPWKYVMQRPQVMYNANYPEFTKLQADAEDALIPAGIMDASSFLPAEAPANWHVYFAVDNADETVEKTLARGGTVIQPAEDTPFGRNAALTDVTGAPFWITQEIKQG